MSIKIYTCPSEEESVRSLGYEVGVEIGNNYAPSFSNDIVLRLGNSRKVYNNRSDKDNGVVSDFPNVINAGKNVRANLNKLRSLEMMATVMKNPKIFTIEVPIGVKAVIREHEHSCGSNFAVHNGPFELDENHYATEYLETQKEYRVWFCGNETLVGLRTPLNDEQRNRRPVCRSKWGYSFMEGQFRKLREQVLKAAKVIGVEIGAADVLLYNEEYLMLEVNSSPSMDINRIRSFYQESIERYARQKFPRLFETRRVNPIPVIPPRQERILSAVWTPRHTYNGYYSNVEVGD